MECCCHLFLHACSVVDQVLFSSQFIVLNRRRDCLKEAESPEKNKGSCFWQVANLSSQHVLFLPKQHFSHSEKNGNDFCTHLLFFLGAMVMTWFQSSVSPSLLLSFRTWEKSFLFLQLREA